MKTACNVIQDLLILYEDDACSFETKKLVQEHLAECPACTDYLKRLYRASEWLPDSFTAPLLQEDELMKSSFQKIKKRWVLSLLAVLMLFPICAAGVLACHEYQGHGTAFTNLDDIYRCVRYLKCIEHKNFEKAADYVHFSNRVWGYSSQDAAGNIYENGIAEGEDAEEIFIESLRQYDALGLSISGISCSHVERYDTWQVAVSFTEHYPDKSSQQITVNLDGETLNLYGITQNQETTFKMQFLPAILSFRTQYNKSVCQDYEPMVELKKGEQAAVKWKGSASQAVPQVITLVHIDSGTAATAFESFHTSAQPFWNGTEINLSVPGRYAIFTWTEEGRYKNLAEFVDIEIHT